MAEISEKNAVSSCPSILNLPQEVFVIIAGNLQDDADIAAFSLTCKRFLNVYKDRMQGWLKRSLHQGLPTGVPPTLMGRFLEMSVDPATLTECNFNNCYWIPPTMLKSFIVKCPNLETLLVAETGITAKHLISSILPTCRKITVLSISMSSGDWKCAKQPVPTFITSRNGHISYRNTVFKKSCTVLAKLKTLAIVVKGSTQNFVQLIGHCRNLEHLTVVRDLECRADYEKYCTETFPPLRRARTVVFSGNILDVSCSPELNFGPQLTTLWGATLPSPSRVNWSGKFSALSLKFPGNLSFYLSVEESERYFKTLDVSQLESICEAGPVFMRTRIVAPQLKLANIAFDYDGFEHFCKNHTRLETLRLRSCGGELPVEGTVMSARSWAHFSQLRALSMDANLIVGESRSHSSGIVTRSFLAGITQSCPLLEELEIGFFIGSLSFREIKIKSEDLSVISQCKSIKKLTLTSVIVSDGRFLTEILKSCSRLESLRLKELGSGSSYSKELCTALLYAKNLKTFCLFQSDFDQMSGLLNALESCSSLTRMSLRFPSSSYEFTWPMEDFPQRLLRFCLQLPRLVAVFCVLTIENSHAVQVTELLNQVVTPIRPAFRADVQQTRHPFFMLPIKYDSNILPLIHKEILIKWLSEVAVFPNGHRSFLI